MHITTVIMALGLMGARMVLIKDLALLPFKVGLVNIYRAMVLISRTARGLPTDMIKFLNVQDEFRKATGKYVKTVLEVLKGVSDFSPHAALDFMEDWKKKFQAAAMGADEMAKAVRNARLEAEVWGESGTFATFMENRLALIQAVKGGLWMPNMTADQKWDRFRAQADAWTKGKVKNEQDRDIKRTANAAEETLALWKSLMPPVLVTF